MGRARPLTFLLRKRWNDRGQHLHPGIGHYYLCTMRKQVSLQRSISLSILSVVIVNLAELEAGQEGRGVEVIIETAKALQRNLREADTVFRWDEDEFLALLFGTDAPSCRRKVEQLATLFRLWREANGPVPVPVKVRLGAATHEKDIVFAAVLQAARAAARQHTRI